MDCKHDWVTWENCPTRVVTLGPRGVGEKDEFRPQDELFIIIPGNPGLAGFYQEFMISLKTSLDDASLSVWSVSHVGHDTADPPHLPRLQTFSLEDQILHKLHFLESNVPRSTRVTLLGHSVGCKVIMEIIKRNTTHNIIGSYFMFPMVEGMALTERGREVEASTSYLRQPLVFLLAAITVLLPRKILELLICLLVRGVPPSVQQTIRDLANPNCVNNCLVMAAHELATIKELDVATIRKMRGKLRVYFAQKDGWCPDEFREHLEKAVGIEEDTVVDNNNIKHAFVLRSGDEMGRIIAQWTTKKWR